MAEEHGGRMLLGFSGQTRCREMEGKERQHGLVW